MRSIWALVFCIACSVDHSGLRVSEFDGGSGLDAGPQPDAPRPGDAGFDAGFDAATRDAAMRDAATPDAAVSMDANLPDAFDAGCPMGVRECVDDVLRECTPRGWEPQQECDYECREDGPNASCFDLVPSNLSRPMSAAPGGNVVVNDALWNTDDCGAIDNNWYVQTVPGEIDLCVVSYDNVTFQSDLRVVGGRGLVIVAKGDITIEGMINADGEGTTPGPGAASGELKVSVGVATYSGGNGQTQAVTGSTFNSDGGGGGGGAFADGGGGGSTGGLGTEAAGGTPGASFGGGTYRLIPLRAGGAGGAAGPGPSRGFGGGGGGAIQFSARGDIRVDARINVSGGGGIGGASANSNGGGGGGGGGGGTVHFEAGGAVHFQGSNEVLAAGGGGGGGGACSVDGGDGGEEESGGTGGGSRGGVCGDTNFSTVGGAGDEDERGHNAAGLRRSTANGGGGGGAGGLIVVRASSRMGGLNGTGRSVDERPTIAAIE